MVLYSPETSLNGAKLLLNKGPPRKVTIEDVSDALTAPTILTPHALPMFRDLDIGRGTKRKREKERMDPKKSRRPELPVTGPGKGGRVGASATQHVVQNLVRDTTRDVDVSTSLPDSCSFDGVAGSSLAIYPFVAELARLPSGAFPRLFGILMMGRFVDAFFFLLVFAPAPGSIAQVCG